MKELRKINKTLVSTINKRKKEYYRKVLAELIEDLEGRTYLDKKEDFDLWEQV